MQGDIVDQEGLWLDQKPYFGGLNKVPMGQFWDENLSFANVLVPRRALVESLCEILIKLGKKC